MRKFICGVPTKECCGADLMVNKALTVKKGHGTSEEAFKCYAKWLISQGYKQIGHREFQKDNEPIIVLTKKSKFGGQLRYGKGDKGIKGNRYIPRIGHMAKAGIVISN